MRNKALEELNVLVGDWKLTLSDAWFLEPAGSQVHGLATIEWLGDAFLMRCAAESRGPRFEARDAD